MKYIKVKKLIINLINMEHLNVGDVLPSENQLSLEYNAARNTIRKAIQELEQEGFLHTKQGIGTFIKKQSIRSNVNNLLSYSEEMNYLNKPVLNRVVEFKTIIVPSAIAYKLDIPLNSMIYHIDLLRIIDDKPIMREENFISVEKFPDLSIKDVQRSKFSFFEEKHNIKILGSYKTYTTILADSISSQLLLVDKYTPLLYVMSKDVDMQSKPINYSLTSINVKLYNTTLFIKR